MALRLNLSENGMDDNGCVVVGIQHTREASEEHKKMVEIKKMMNLIIERNT